MTVRYYVPPPLTAGPRQLEGPEAHHLLHVMRANAGDRIVLFDGQGVEGDAVVVAAGRNTATVEVQQVRRHSVELPAPLHLGVALPKGERQKWLVEKCVELGAASVTPLITCRSVAQPTDKARQRLRRSVIEASKQCGRNQLMEVSEAVELATWLSAAPAAAQRWIADPRGAPARLSGESAAYVAVGPEGGFDPAETEQACELGWAAVSLGPRVLRVETAAVAVAAAFALS